MTKVRMRVTGTAVGASGENEGFAELARSVIGDVTPNARPEISVAADDNVTIELTLDRAAQSDVGEALERLLSDAVVYSEVIADDEPAG